MRQYTDKETGRVGYDAVYIAQPLATETLNSKVIFFDNKVRPLLNAFLSRFAGSGEEMQGTAGHFTFSVWPKASEYGSRDENSFDDWKHARLFYAATNGDSVFIKPDGSTAWHVLETDEFIPIAGTFDKFIDIYADFRGSHDVFDSWAYREYRENRTKR